MYSIIIPHKNIFDLLLRSINSIPINLNCQIIIVDDASSPDVKTQLKELSDMDERIELYETEGRGAGEARNIGLKHATGEWTIFMDADDFFTETAHNVLLHYENSQCDIIYFCVKSAYSNTLQPALRHLHKTQNFHRFSNKKDKFEKWLRYEYTEPWGKIFRTDFLKSNQIRFDETRVSNDYFFSVVSGHLATKIDWSIEPFYCVSVRENSLCNNMYDTFPKMISRVKAYLKVEEFFKIKNVNLYPCSVFTLKILSKNLSNSHELIKELRKLGIRPQDILIKYPLNCLKTIPKKIYEWFKLPLLGY